MGAVQAASAVVLKGWQKVKARIVSAAPLPSERWQRTRMGRLRKASGSKKR